MSFTIKCLYSGFLLLVIAGLLRPELQAQPVAKNGVIDLSDINFNKNQEVELNGDWGFYWQQLVSPDSAFDLNPDEYVKFPHLWNTNERLDSYGYATYTLRIILPNDIPTLALSIPDLYTSYTLWINGEEFSENGTVATTKEAYTPFWMPITKSLPHLDSDTLHVVLQVANFHHSKGGIRLPIKMGSERFLLRNREISLGSVFFLTGCLLVIGLFFLGLFLFGRHEVPMLYFAFVCIIFSYRIIGTDLYFLHNIFPFLPWILTLKLEYFSLYFSAALFCEFVRKLYPNEIVLSLNYIFTGFFTLLSLVTILFPPYFFTKLITYFFITFPFLVIYITWVYYKAVQRKRDGARFALASIVLIFLVFLHNLLEYFTLAEEILVLNFFGLFAFFFLQSLILSYRFTNSLSRAKTRAEEAALAKSQFLSTMSHEIRTPLNAVIGLSELLINSDSEKEKTTFAHNIKKNGENLLELINNILDFSKLDTTGIDTHYQPVHLRHTLDEVLRLLSPLYKAKDLKILIDIDPNISEWILTDLVMLKQILINLTGNAIKFTDQGNIKIRVMPNANEKHKGNILFEIQDTGTGISEEDASRLFRSFSQVDSSSTRKYGGTGLGLVISKKLSENLHGSIWFSSKLNEGSVFCFTIQADAVEAPSGTISKSQENSQKTDLPFRKDLKVLIVEDNVMNRIVIQKILEKTDIRPDVAENGEIALDKTLNGEYDLIFMDMEMPVMDGIEATKEIRSSLKNISRPVIIAMTANAFKEDRQRCLDAGMDDFIPKPISIQVVHSKLEQWFP